jgi:glycosyltransferase involved in cell wall biosynthesis
VPAKKKEKKPSQKRLRDIAWGIGQKHPAPPEIDHMALLMIHPHRGHVYWHIMKKSLDALKKRLGRISDHASQVVRVYDVTDIIFDGSNAHTFFDIEVRERSGHYYFGIDRPARNFLAEAGLRCKDGSFHCLARSNTVFFDRDRPSGNYRTEGFFGGGAINRTFSVENIFDAQVYERMNRELAEIKRTGPLSVAEIFLDISHHKGSDNPLDTFIRNVSGRFEKFGVNARVFSAQLKTAKSKSFKSFIESINVSSQTLYRQLSAAHKQTPFHIVHCHDWYSSKVGLTASKKLNLPMVLTLHSTEHDRSNGRMTGLISSKIRTIEKTAVQNASLVIVPHSSTRQQAINMYDAHPETVVVIPHIFQEKSTDAPPDSSEVRRWLGLNQHAPIVLFSGEISHAAGADIMVDALPAVCRNHGRAQFVFAGDGPLKGELEARASHMGIGHKCRFLGDVSRKSFDALLMASDFVVIPARTWQDEGLAQMAITNGKPVLTTRQAGIGCVRHGENGLVTFDNPGSIVWGIQELLSHPLHGSMLRIVAKKNAGETLSFETIAARHYMHYELVLKSHRVLTNA